MESLNKGPGHRDLSHEQFTESILRNKSNGLVPKISVNWFEIVGLVAGTKLWSLQPDLVAKMASSHDETCEKSWPKTQVVKYIA